MAVKKRYIECECGEQFSEVKGNQLEGEVVLGPWLFKGGRKREAKTPDGSEILLAFFERSVSCGKCKQELLHEKRQYELTPPAINDDPVTFFSTREFVVIS